MPPACPPSHGPALFLPPLTFQGRTAWSAGRAGSGGEPAPSMAPSLCSPVAWSQDGDGLSGPLRAPCPQCRGVADPSILQRCSPGGARPVLLPAGSGSARHWWAVPSGCCRQGTFSQPLPASRSGWFQLKPDFEKEKLIFHSRSQLPPVLHCLLFLLLTPSRRNSPKFFPSDQKDL